MKDDLISRKALLNRFKYSETDNETDKAWICTVRRIIKEQPTAFDKEKVIKELEERKDLYDINEEALSTIGSKEYIWECCDIREHKGKHMAYDDAIKIVEKGGLT